MITAEYVKALLTAEPHRVGLNSHLQANKSALYKDRKKEVDNRKTVLRKIIQAQRRPKDEGFQR